MLTQTSGVFGSVTRTPAYERLSGGLKGGEHRAKAQAAIFVDRAKFGTRVERGSCKGNGTAVVYIFSKLGEEPRAESAGLKCVGYRVGLVL